MSGDWGTAVEDEQPYAMKLLHTTRTPPLSVSPRRLTRLEIQRLRSLAQTDKNCYNIMENHDTPAPSPNSILSNGDGTLTEPLASPVLNPAAAGSCRQRVPVRADTGEPLQFAVQKMSSVASEKSHTEKPLQAHPNPSMDCSRRKQWMQIVANYQQQQQHQKRSSQEDLFLPTKSLIPSSPPRSCWNHRRASFDMTEVSSLTENAADAPPPSHPIVPLARLLLVGRQVQQNPPHIPSPSIPKAIECRQLDASSRHDASSSSSSLNLHLHEESWNEEPKRTSSNDRKRHRTTLSFVANEILVPLVMSIILYKILYMLTNDDNDYNRHVLLEASTALALYQPQNFTCTSSTSEQMFEMDRVFNSWREKRRALVLLPPPSAGLKRREARKPNATTSSETLHTPTFFQHHNNSVCQATDFLSLQPEASLANKVPVADESNKPVIYLSSRVNVKVIPELNHGVLTNQQYEFVDEPRDKSRLSQTIFWNALLLAGEYSW